MLADDIDISCAPSSMGAAELCRLIRQLCEPGMIKAVVQPLVRPSDRSVVGYESLARMTLDPIHPPDWWLEQAEQVGMRHQLELACLEAAAALGPPPEGRTLFVNISPSMLFEPRAFSLLDGLGYRVVVELTEQQELEDAPEVRARLATWMAHGLRFALDDVGAGRDRLQGLLEIGPDFLKLDRTLIAGIDADRNRQALARSFVAFAHEVGCSIIAEGVETIGQLDAVRAVGIDLVQGYVYAKPGAPWPGITSDLRPALSVFADIHDAIDRNVESDLARSLARTASIPAACAAVVEHLFATRSVMPSLYLERDGELRCFAQRGLWQVLDGFSESFGITGRTWKSGVPVLVADVSLDPDYVEAIPGIVAEACVPIMIDGRSAGALNVESVIPLPNDIIELLEGCARLLALRLHELDVEHLDLPWQRARSASIAITGLACGPDLAEQTLLEVCAAARMDSGALLFEPSATGEIVAVGPLARFLTAMSSEEREAVADLVRGVRSCYTPGETFGRGSVSTDSLRDGGARAIVVLPLLASRRRVGTLVLAHSRPLHLDSCDVEPLEMLADYVAALLSPGVT